MFASLPPAAGISLLLAALLPDGMTFGGLLRAAAPYLAVGFLAQIVDGALGMAYGVVSNSLLLALIPGIRPAIASASVHTAEVFTTGVSGLSHLKLGNVQRGIVLRLAIPGVVGGVVGAYVLSSLPGEKLRPFVAVYLLVIGVMILLKARRGPATNAEGSEHRHLFPLGLIGGFFDAIGGGGWGPIVTSTLVARGHHPRFAVGSVNLAEFFVTACQVGTFVATLGGQLKLVPIFGLMVGGVIAAPMAAVICRKIPPRALMLLVAVLIILLSIRTLLLALG